MHLVNVFAIDFGFFSPFFPQTHWFSQHFPLNLTNPLGLPGDGLQLTLRFDRAKHSRAGVQQLGRQNDGGLADKNMGKPWEKQLQMGRFLGDLLPNLIWLNMGYIGQMKGGMWCSFFRQTHMEVIGHCNGWCFQWIDFRENLQNQRYILFLPETEFHQTFWLTLT